MRPVLLHQPGATGSNAGLRRTTPKAGEIRLHIPQKQRKCLEPNARR